MSDGPCFRPIEAIGKIAGVFVSEDENIIDVVGQEYYKPCGEPVWTTHWVDHDERHYCVKPVDHCGMHESISGYQKENIGPNEDRKDAAFAPFVNEMNTKETPKEAQKDPEPEYPKYINFTLTCHEFWQEDLIRDRLSRLAEEAIARGIAISVDSYH